MKMVEKQDEVPAHLSGVHCSECEDTGVVNPMAPNGTCHIPCSCPFGEFVEGYTGEGE